MDADIEVLGLSEHEYRTRLEEELVHAMRAEGGAPTIHAIAHAVARVAELDHLRIAEQLSRAGVSVAPKTRRRAASAGRSRSVA
jgi:hypothetical protein